MKPILWIALLVGVSVASSKLRPARQVGTTCSAAGKTKSDTSCCGNLFYNSPAPGLYQYYASDKELAGTCCRNGFTLGGSTFTLTPAELEANSAEGNYDQSLTEIFGLLQSNEHWPETGRISLACRLASGPDPFFQNLTQSAICYGRKVRLCLIAIILLVF